METGHPRNWSHRVRSERAPRSDAGPTPFRSSPCVLTHHFLTPEKDGIGSSPICPPVKRRSVVVAGREQRQGRACHPPVARAFHREGIDVRKLKTRPFIRDIDDVQHYADIVENIYTLQYEELGELLAQFPIIKSRAGEHWECLDLHKDLAGTYEALARVRHTMSLVIREMADRKRRLANAARRLADVELDEEST